MSRSRGSISLSCLCVLAATGVAVAQTPLRVGTEFQVNSYTPDRQYVPAIGIAADGDFVVAWESRNQDGNSYGVFARRFNSSGAGLAVEFQVNSYTDSLQRAPAVAMNGGGAFVVVWRSDDQTSDYADVFGQRFDADGSRNGVEFQVNTRTSIFQLAPTVAMESNGDFVVAWGSQQSDPGYGVRAQRFDSAGARLGGEFQVNSITTEEQRYPALAMDDDGDFVVAWVAQLDGFTTGVFARRFVSSGTPVGGDFQVNVYTYGGQVTPAVGMDAEGDFVIVWSSYPQDAGGVFGQRFASSGASQGTEFQINAYTPFNQKEPSVAMDSDGNFLVAWQSFNQDGVGSYAIMAQRFGAGGSRLGDEFKVNTVTGNSKKNPAVRSNADGDFVVAWQSEPQDGNYHGVFAQRFSPSATLDIDADGEIDPLTDGTLVLRHLFDSSGQALVSGAVDGDCLRCDATAIGAYLESIESSLDVDLNTFAEPLFDGILVIRYLFEFRGMTLSDGAVGANADRDTPEEIETYLESLL